MIGCPVGSIHRGDNGEIVIEDWCIGCSLCADQCPYGSIQMHDIGIIPAGAGLAFGADPAVGQAPFGLDRQVQPGLPSYASEPGQPRPAMAEFRYEFRLPPARRVRHLS